MSVLLLLVLNFSCVKDTIPNELVSIDYVFVEGNGIIKSFFISKYEINIKQFLEFQRATGYKTAAERLDSAIVYNPRYRFEKGVNFRHDILGYPLPEEDFDILPVARVTPEDAQAFAQWIGARIPTNDEWAYAAKGGLKSKGFMYPGGNNPNRIGHFDRPNAVDITRPQAIGQKEPNELGIFDMGGNLAEITLNPQEPEIRRALGGSYFLGPSHARLENIHKGNYSKLNYANTHPSPLEGFRIVKDAR